MQKLSIRLLVILSVTLSLVICAVFGFLIYRWRWDVNSAVASGDLSRLRAVLENGGNPNRISIEQALRTKVKWPPLMHAIYSGDADAALLLMEHGADVQVSNESGKNALLIMGVSPRHLSPVQTEQVLLALVEAGADVRHTDVDGRTVLHHAVNSNNQALVRCLLQQKASPRAKDRWGATPIHLAVASTADIEIVEMLLQYGADPSIKDRTGQSVADRAQSGQWQYYDTLRQLLGLQ